MTMTPLRSSFLAALAAFALAGCQHIRVLDPEGFGVAGATISTRGVDEQGNPAPGPEAVTNRFGDAILSRPWHTPDPDWMYISAPGYFRRGIEYPTDWSYHIYLQRVSEEIAPPR